MSKQLEGKTCEVCHAYLFEDDDIVYCSECGAPYHRDCYAAVGKCVYEQFHGTDKAYDALKKSEKSNGSEAAKTKCMGCGRDIIEDAPYCPYCGRPTSPRAHRTMSAEEILSAPMSRGGIPKDKVIADGVTADEAAMTVGINSSKYVPEFVKNKKYNWNWVAFLFPAAWLGFRKMYKHCAVAVAVMIVAAILSVPFYSELLAAGSTVPVAEQETLKLVTVALSNASVPALLLYAVGFLLEAGLGVVTSLFSTRFYRSTVITRVRELKEQAEEKGVEPKELYLKKGGVNLFLFLGILAIQSNITYLMDLLCELL